MSNILMINSLFKFWDNIFETSLIIQIKLCLLSTHVPRHIGILFFIIHKADIYFGNYKVKRILNGFLNNAELKECIYSSPATLCCNLQK